MRDRQADAQFVGDGLDARFAGYGHMRPEPVLGRWGLDRAGGQGE